MARVMIQENRVAEIVRKQIIVTLREIMSDPDSGLQLRQGFITRLQKSRRSKQAGKLRDLRDVIK